MKANELGVRKVTKVTKGATEQPAAQPAVHISREGREECRTAGRQAGRQAERERGGRPKSEADGQYEQQSSN